MKLPKWLTPWRKKQPDFFEVMAFGKKMKIGCKKDSSEQEAQDYVNANLVICGHCGSPIFPGQKFWLYSPPDESELKRCVDTPGVIFVKDQDEKAVFVSCLGWNCCPTAAIMCGELLEGRQIHYFESPISQVMRTGKVIVVSDIDSYQGPTNSSEPTK